MLGTGQDFFFLKTERLAFRCWTTDDFPLARALWGDAEVTRFFGGPFSDEIVREKLHREIDRMGAHQFQYWPMHLRADYDHVGCCGLRPYQPDLAPHKFVHELGFHLLARYWGQGLATEAANGVIRYAFESIHAEGLVAGHHPQNVNSKKVLEKLGFQFTHEEYFPELRMNIPYYALRPTHSPRHKLAV
jgi:[ribosomal protein S5]-alanine N-acetyltransferase